MLSVTLLAYYKKLNIHIAENFIKISMYKKKSFKKSSGNILTISVNVL